jgi:hypothetical protein
MAATTHLLTCTTPPSLECETEGLFCPPTPTYHLSVSGSSEGGGFFFAYRHPSTTPPSLKRGRRGILPTKTHSPPSIAQTRYGGGFLLLTTLHDPSLERET